MEGAGSLFVRDVSFACHGGSQDYATTNKCIATSNKCLTSSNKKLVETILNCQSLGVYMFVKSTPQSVWDDGTMGHTPGCLLKAGCIIALHFVLPASARALSRLVRLWSCHDLLQSPKVVCSSPCERFLVFTRIVQGDMCDATTVPVPYRRFKKQKHSVSRFLVIFFT